MGSISIESVLKLSQTMFRKDHSPHDFTAPGTLFEPLENSDLRCTACANRCLIHPGREGICHVRSNREGELPRALGLCILRPR